MKCYSICNYCSNCISYKKYGFDNIKYSCRSGIDASNIEGMEQCGAFNDASGDSLATEIKYAKMHKESEYVEQLMSIGIESVDAYRAYTVMTAKRNLHYSFQNTQTLEHTRKYGINEK